MDARKPRLPVSATVLGVWVLAASSAGSLYAGVRSAQASAETARIAAFQNDTLVALAARFERLERACNATAAPAFAIHSRPQLETAPVGTLPPEQIDALAANVAERLAELDVPEPTPHDADHLSALDDANRIFSQALDRGSWTEGHAEAMRALVGRLHTEDLVELRQRLAAAVNENELDLTQPATF